MKNFFVLVFCMLAFSASSKADQLQALTLEQADSAIDYIKTHKIKSLILYCGCCDGDTALLVTIDEVNKLFDDVFYTLQIIGHDAKGNEVITTVDLAYVHLNVGGIGTCFGKLLNFGCDPCVKPFAWNDNVKEISFEKS